MNFTDPSGLKFNIWDCIAAVAAMYVACHQAEKTHNPDDIAKCIGAMALVMKNCFPEEEKPKPKPEPKPPKPDIIPVIIVTPTPIPRPPRPFPGFGDGGDDLFPKPGERPGWCIGFGIYYCF